MTPSKTITHRKSCPACNGGAELPDDNACARCDGAGVVAESLTVEYDADDRPTEPGLWIRVPDILAPVVSIALFLVNLAVDAIAWVIFGPRADEPGGDPLYKRGGR